MQKYHYQGWEDYKYPSLYKSVPMKQTCTFPDPQRIKIQITRDNEANVYTATCDAMGLVCEAETLADLFQAMADVAPDLIEANGVEL